MSEQFQNLESALTTLSQKELKQLRARLDFLAAPAEEDSADLQLVASAIECVLKELGAPSINYPTLVRTKIFPRFKAKAPLLLGFISDYFAPKTRTERVKIMRILLRALAVQTRQCNPAGLSTATLIDRIPHVADDVDAEFPGYLAAGLLPLIVQQSAG